MLLSEIIEGRRTEDLFLTPRDLRTADYIEGVWTVGAVTVL